jgi:hypothetical protein
VVEKRCPRDWLVAPAAVFAKATGVLVVLRVAVDALGTAVLVEATGVAFLAFHLRVLPGESKGSHSVVE